VDAILGAHRRELGADFDSYRNHACRVFLRCCRMLHEPDATTVEKVAIAAAFHDLAIWTAETWDYLQPSCLLARDYLAGIGHSDWAGEIEAMIAWHHKITPCRAAGPLAEAFRRADWRDVLLLPFPETSPALPNAGFHLRLTALTWNWWKRHPLDPLPMLRW
jgi:hypothetical protein